MKNYTQVYVKNSIEAAKTYCKAFGADITFEEFSQSNKMKQAVRTLWKFEL